MHKNSETVDRQSISYTVNVLSIVAIGVMFTASLVYGASEIPGTDGLGFGIGTFALPILFGTLLGAFLGLVVQAFRRGGFKTYFLPVTALGAGAVLGLMVWGNMSQAGW